MNISIITGYFVPVQCIPVNLIKSLFLLNSVRKNDGYFDDPVNSAMADQINEQMFSSYPSAFDYFSKCMISEVSPIACPLIRETVLISLYHLLD
jgi:hypothetical protein